MSAAAQRLCISDLDVTGNSDRERDSLELVSVDSGNLDNVVFFDGVLIITDR